MSASGPRATVHGPRLMAMVRKELRQLFRDPRSARIMFLSPVVQLLLFGYAVNTDVRHVPTLVLDHDRTAESRELVQTLAASGYFRLTGYAGRPADLARALEHGDALVALEIPTGFAAGLAAGAGTRVQVLVDGTSSNTATVALGYATQIIQRFAADRSPVAGSRSPSVDWRPRALYNPELISRVYNVPGVIGTIIMLMSLLLTALAIVREREIGTLEQLMVSPLSPAELILGKTLPVVLVALVDVVLITAVARLWFEIPFRGDFLLLLAASLVYILSGLGLGLLISTVSTTQQEAFMSMFFFFLPAIILSGFMYPVENMPEAIQWLTLANPIRHYLVVVRGVFLKGAGADVLWPQLATLTLMGATVLWVAMRRFRKTAG